MLFFAVSCDDSLKSGDTDSGDSTPDGSDSQPDESDKPDTGEAVADEDKTDDDAADTADTADDSGNGSGGSHNDADKSDADSGSGNSDADGVCCDEDSFYSVDEDSWYDYDEDHYYNFDDDDETGEFPTVVTCTNGNDGRGLLKTCVNDECETVTCPGSCNRQGTACGESNCIDYTIECRDDMLTDSSNGGAIAQCQFGKWEIMSTCTDGASCNKETGDCGECKNGNTKCENHEISGIMNKSCNYQGECETDSNGNLKYYSATIGVQLLCYDGRWSDYNDLTRSSYCPPVNHTFQIYKNYSLTDWSTAMTKVYRSANTYDDYHYSSCHNSGAVSECGTCHNSFHVCGDEYYSNKLVGHILNCQNGMLTYGNYCGDKNQLCQDITQCK